MVTCIEPVPLTLDAGGTPYSTRYGDVYHSRAGGYAQAREVFLGGNRLPQRWAGRDSFTIVETGFGLGTNFLATWAAWQEDPGRPRRLHYVSIEHSPFAAADLLGWHARDPAAAPLAAALAEAWPLPTPGLHRIAFADQRVLLTLALGEAEAVMGQLRLRADAFYFDGFAPSRNPDMWSAALFRRAARLAAPGATFATYTEAASVAAGLSGAGFLVAKEPGFAGKRARLAGAFEPRWRVRRHEPPAAPAWPARAALVVGGGIAGVATAAALVRSGWEVDIVEAAGAPAQRGSGAPAGVLHPLIARDDGVPARLTRAGFLHMKRHLGGLDGSAAWFAACGHFHCARSAEEEGRIGETLSTLRLPPGFVRSLSAGDASELAGTRLAQGGYWFPGAGWVRAAAWCGALMGTAGAALRFHPGHRAAALLRADGEWRVEDPGGVVLARAPVAVLAAGADLGLPGPACAVLSAALAGTPLQRIRGQLTGLPAAMWSGPRIAVSGAAYCLPAIDGTVWCGATYDAGSPEQGERSDDHDDNLRRLGLVLPGAPRSAAVVRSHVGLRAVAPDRLPLVGALPDAAACAGLGLRGAHLQDLPRLEGLYVVGGLASRGLAWAALAGETLACVAAGDPPPVESDLLDAIDPARFLLKSIRRIPSGPRRAQP